MGFSCHPRVGVDLLYNKRRCPLGGGHDKKKQA